MTDSDAPSRSRTARLARWGGGLLAGLLVLVLAAALLIPQFFTSEELKSYVVPPMEEATGRQVEIDEIRLRVLWTPAVSVSGFRLADREGYGPEPAVSAGALNVEVALWPLLTGTIRPTAVELVDPTIRYTVAEDGATNFDDLLAPDTTQAADDEDGLPDIPVSDFRTSGAQVRYQDRGTGQALELDFDAQLSLLPDGDVLTSAGTVDVRALRALLPDVQADTMTVTDARVDYDVRADLSSGGLDLSTLTVETAPLTLRTTGTVTRLTTRPTLDLTVEAPEADLAQLAAFAPAAAVEGLNPTGTLELTATVRGPLPDSTGATDSLSVEGTGRLSGIGVDYQGTALLRGLSADLALSLDEAALRAVQGQLLGADLAGSVAVTDPTGTPRVALDLKTGAMNLADLAAFAPPEQVEGYNPQGTLRLDLRAEGPLPEGTETLDRLTVDGAGRLAGVGVDYEGTALLRELGADLAFTGTSAAVRGLTGQLLGERLEGEVTVQNPLGDATVEGRLAGAADLARLSAFTADESSGEAPSIAGRAEYDVRFSGPLDAPDAIRPSGQVRLVDVRYPYESFRHPLEVPAATVKLTGTGLSMDRFTIRTGEQAMALQTTVRNLFPVSKGLAETNPAMALDFTFTADRLDLVALYPEAETDEVYYSQLFAATLSGSQVNGRSPETLAEELYGGTELPAYAVDGRVEIGTFLNDPQRIDDLAFDVRMRDRRLVAQNLSGTTYGGQLAGSIVFDQSGTTAASARARGEGSVLMAARGPAGAPARPAAPPPSALDYDVRLTGAQASAFLEDWTTLGRVVQGTLDLNVTGDSPLSAGLLPLASGLTAKGTSIVADGGLSLDLGVTKVLVDRLGLGSSVLTKFQRFGGPFTIEDGTLEMGTWTLGGAATTAELTGALGLGGSVDVEMRMALPMTALQNSKIPGLVGGGDGALAGLVQKLAGSDAGDATIPVRIAIGGTMRDPTVEVVDKDAVRAAIQRLVKEQGLGRLRDLLPGGG